jgi:hypothetical protein
MSLWQSLLNKLGLKSMRAERHPIRVFLLDDDKRRHRWFTARFKGDLVDIASDVKEALQLLSTSSYDAIFLDHDLHPEHYHAESTDDERTGYAVAVWLCSNPASGQVAQLVERGPEKAGVGGSIPSLATNSFQQLSDSKKRVRISRANNTRTSYISHR